MAWKTGLKPGASERCRIHGGGGTGEHIGIAEGSAPLVAGGHGHCVGRAHGGYHRGVRRAVRRPGVGLSGNQIEAAASDPQGDLSPGREAARKAQMNLATFASAGPGADRGIRLEGPRHRRRFGQGNCVAARNARIAESGPPSEHPKTVPPESRSAAHRHRGRTCEGACRAGKEPKVHRVPDIATWARLSKLFRPALRDGLKVRRIDKRAALPDRKDAGTIGDDGKGRVRVERAELLRDILDAQLEMVCRFSRDGTIRFVNRAYASALGKEPGDLIGRSLWPFVAGSDRGHVQEELTQLTEANRVVRVENGFETPQGTRWTLWRNVGIRFDEQGNWLEAQSSGFDVTDLKLLEEQRELLVAELNHRVRNTLMVVQGIAHQTFKGVDVPGDRLEAFNARLFALASAHTALSRSNWSGADLADLVRQALSVCGGDLSRITTRGPSVTLHPNAVVSLVLVMHELATNAIKYGALAQDAGHIMLAWTVAHPAAGEPVVELDWRELGGTPVIAPSRTGFGTRLITTSVRHQLGGQVTLDYAPAGLTCHIAFPLKEAPA